MSLQIGDVVVSTDSGDKKFKVIQVKPLPGPAGTLYLCEAEGGERIQRFIDQLRKVE